MSAEAGPGGRGGTCGVRRARATQTFVCHMCNRQQNEGEWRTGQRSTGENPTGWDHFCEVCARSEGTLERRFAWNSHGTVGNRGISGRVSGAAGSGGVQNSSPIAQRGVAAAAVGSPASSSAISRAADRFASSGGGSSGGSAAATPVSSACEPLGGNMEEDLNDEEPDEGEAKEDDPHGWSNRGLQDAIPRSGKAVTMHLPTIGVDGRLYPPGTKVKAETLLPPPRVVAAQFMEKFPEAPICRPLQSVETRALAAMQPSAATPAMKKKATRETGAVALDKQLREAAMGVFATIQVVIALYVHEVVHFEELASDERFQASEENNNFRTYSKQ